MTRRCGVVACGVLLASTVVAAQAAAQHPSWAYGFVDAPPPAGASVLAPLAIAAAPAVVPVPDATPRSLPGGTRTFTRGEANNVYGPAAPPIVAIGRRDASINACGLCHYLGGQGRQENAGLADLSYEYFVQTMLDFKSGFVAYAPIGSLKAGEGLLKTGGRGKTVQCATCHGPDLSGLGPVPGIARRWPSYLVRQMYDMQVGTRKGAWSPLMKAVVENLTADGMIAIAAYTASLPPQERAAQTASR